MMHAGTEAMTYVLLNPFESSLREAPSGVQLEGPHRTTSRSFDASQPSLSLLTEGVDGPPSTASYPFVEGRLATTK